MKRPDIKNEVMGMRAVLNQTEHALETPWGRSAVGLTTAGSDALLSNLERIETGIGDLVGFDPFSNLRADSRPRQGVPQGQRSQRSGAHGANLSRSRVALAPLSGQSTARYPDLSGSLRPQHRAPVRPTPTGPATAGNDGNQNTAVDQQPTATASGTASAGGGSSRTQPSRNTPAARGNADRSRLPGRPPTTSSRHHNHRPINSLAERRRQALLAMKDGEEQPDTNVSAGQPTSRAKIHNPELIDSGAVHAGAIHPRGIHPESMPPQSRRAQRTGSEQTARAPGFSRPWRQPGVAANNSDLTNSGSVTSTGGYSAHSRPPLDLRSRPIPALPESISQGLKLFNAAYEQGVDLT